MRAGTLANSLPSQRRAEMALADDAAQGWRERVDAERASLERLHLVVVELFKAVSNALQDEREAAEECIRRACAIVGVDLPVAISGVAVPLPGIARSKPIRGGLAPWQIRRVTTHIDTNLHAAITTKDLAALAKLSSFHFCRAFKDSFGESPHSYVMRRRVERAQGLMLTSDVPLGQIAADCGLADQAHFSKLFRRFVGESPGVWRRARAAAPV
jgi:AraC family transcriptional regulator